jgi:hypothetical protein
MNAKIEHLSRAPDGWLLRFRAPDRHDFDQVVARIKSLPRHDWDWDKHALAGRGAWWLSERALWRIGPLLVGFHEALRSATGEEEEEAPRWRRQPPSPRYTAQAPAIPPEVVAAFTQLGLLTTAPSCVVKAAFRALSLEYHPDRVGGDHQRMVALNRAYETVTRWREEHPAA